MLPLMYKRAEINMAVWCLASIHRGEKNKTRHNESHLESETPGDESGL